jgi:NIMA (never in mitosis gene a)-related kinase
LTKETEKNNILQNQSLIVRILRLIFSLEKNRKYFKHLFPTKLLGIFIDIGNYKHNLELYHSFLEEFNSLNEEEIHNLKHKSQNISNPSNEAQTIGGYTIMELIGKGGFGSVYKVKLGNLYFAMKEVVLEEKEIKRMKMLKHKNEENYINEIEILKELDHPNIIKYYTSFFEKDRVYILMELVEGVNLAEYILSLKQKGAKGKEKDIIKIVLDIICAMKYLHMEKGILYRDINPHNVMIDKDFNVKLGDFGLARRLGKEKTEHSTSTQTSFVGSILYSAPEVVMNLPYTEKSDIWSIGCILYQLLMMEPPFDGDNPLAIAKDIVELKYRPLAEEIKSTLLGSIVMKCLVFEKDARPDIEQISCMMGGYLVDKLNFLKREENELKIENDFLKERTYKLELAFNSTNNINANINLTNNNFLSNTGLGFKDFINANYNHLPNSPNTNLVSSERENQFKQSVFKRVSDPLTKVIEMINKLLFLCETPLSNAQDEKYVFIHKFKRKLFSNRDYWNANLVKNEINKVRNF